MKNKYKIAGGIYLIIDPSIDSPVLIKKLQQALQGKIAAVQIWNNWLPGQLKEPLIQIVCDLCHHHEVPVIINNEWQLLPLLPLDGVHFDGIPENYELIKQTIKEDIIIGITCNNDLKVVNWAEDHHLSYLSFCSVFPSGTSTSCELVSFDIIKKARKITAMPIFLAGGISLENINELSGLAYDGIAVVSAILNASDPAKVTREYLKHLNHSN